MAEGDEEEFSDEELAAARDETSPQYEGIVLARAIEIVRHELRMTKRELAEDMGIVPAALYRIVGGSYLVAAHGRQIWFERLAARRPRGIRKL